MSAEFDHEKYLAAKQALLDALWSEIYGPIFSVLVLCKPFMFIVDLVYEFHVRMMKLIGREP